MLSTELDLDISSNVARRVAWAKAMADRGIKVLTLGLSPEQEAAAVVAWEKKKNPDAWLEAVEV